MPHAYEHRWKINIVAERRKSGVLELHMGCRNVIITKKNDCRKICVWSFKAYIFRVTPDTFSSAANFGKLAVLAPILYSHFVVPNFSSYYFTTISVEIFETSCQRGRPREHERLLFSAIIVPISLSSHFSLALARFSGNTWHRRSFNFAITSAQRFSSFYFNWEVIARSVSRTNGEFYVFYRCNITNIILESFCILWL